MVSGKWESIDTFSERLKVPGGWIVRTSYMREGVNNKSTSVALACHTLFVADPNHDWKLTEA